MKSTWGKPYGLAYRTRRGRLVTMHRKGQRVRFIDARGRQVGLEQRNVAPAVVYADTMGWRIATGGSQ